jgi:hypothetical protein
MMAQIAEAAAAIWEALAQRRFGGSKPDAETVEQKPTCDSRPHILMAHSSFF